ncbi:MAG TPA: aminotransferase class III-fold pyridoxal phosphate-dependent enzyme [Acidimicrobiales bacterium]|nr:aminotransferase class III-fold pyridoxal phosphate-dependent enzyme [Acidimicrobiales bacterium]
MLADGQKHFGRGGSQSLELEAIKLIPGGTNSNFRLPESPPRRYWDHGSGSRLTDVDGNEFIDYILGMGTAVLGHSPPRLLDLVSEAQRSLQCPAGQQPAELGLARKIHSFVPSAERVRVGCTGSEMVQLALRLARAATGRDLVVKFEGHYHGWFDSIFAGTTKLPAPGTHGALPQSAGQLPNALVDLAVLPWNDLGLLEGFVLRHGSDVAAVIMEPVLCNTSVIMPEEGYLEGARRLCDEHGIVLIFDEVITGFRLAQGGAQAVLGVTPDLTVLGKALGAGFPLAALAGKASFMDLIVSGGVMHGGTYNANAMAIAAGLAALEELTDPDGSKYSRLRSLSGALVEGLERLSKDSGGSLNTQAVGPVFNTTFDAPGPITDLRSYQASNIAKQRAFIDALDGNGVRVTSRGTWFVSFAHTDEDVEATLLAADRALREIS